MTTKKEKNYFEELISIDVSKHVKKNLLGLSYLSWAWAWTKIKTIYPEIQYKVYEREDGVIYWTDNKTAWVKTSVTLNKIEYIDYMPIMSVKMQSIPLEAIKSTNVNKAIQRSITKAIARHGLGLSLYVGEDLLEDSKEGLDIAANEEMKKIFSKKDINRKIVDKIGVCFQEDWKEKLQEKNKKQFNDLKDKLQSAESLEEIELIKIDNKKDFNSLKKYATEYFEDLIDVGIKCKKDLMFQEDLDQLRNEPLTDDEQKNRDRFQEDLDRLGPAEEIDPLTDKEKEEIKNDSIL